MPAETEVRLRQMAADGVKVIFTSDVASAAASLPLIPNR